MTERKDEMNIENSAVNGADSTTTLDLEVRVQEKLALYKENRVEVKRPSWDETFTKTAHLMSSRSIDGQTKVGAVIVNKDHHILSCGYNGFVAGIDDSVLPNLRPWKHSYVLHAEENCILACEHRPVGCTIYVTGHPCLHCLKLIAQSGITEIVWDSSKEIVMLKDQEVELEIMKRLLAHKLKIREYTPTS